MDKCSQHDILLRQIMDLGNQISDLKSTLVRAIVATVSLCSGALGVLEVIVCI